MTVRPFPARPISPRPTAGGSGYRATADFPEYDQDLAFILLVEQQVTRARGNMDRDQTSIAFLRRRLQEAKLQTMGDEGLALLKLLKHPDLEWSDLLDALACRPGVNAETVALNLHSLLGIPIGAGGADLNCDRRFWEDALRKAGLGAEKVARTHQIRIAD